MSGEEMYAAYRSSMQRAAKNRGLNHEPRWKDLKPWIRRVWECAATDL